MGGGVPIWLASRRSLSAWRVDSLIIQKRTVYLERKTSALILAGPRGVTLYGPLYPKWRSQETRGREGGTNRAPPSFSTQRRPQALPTRSFQGSRRAPFFLSLHGSSPPVRCLQHYCRPDEYDIHPCDQAVSWRIPTPRASQQKPFFGASEKKQRPPGDARRNVHDRGWRRPRRDPGVVRAEPQGMTRVQCRPWGARGASKGRCPLWKPPFLSKRGAAAALVLVEAEVAVAMVVVVVGRGRRNWVKRVRKGHRFWIN